jgi:hypothetical protein
MIIQMKSFTLGGHEGIKLVNAKGRLNTRGILVGSMGRLRVIGFLAIRGNFVVYGGLFVGPVRKLCDESLAIVKHEESK